MLYAILALASLLTGVLAPAQAQGNLQEKQVAQAPACNFRPITKNARLDTPRGKGYVDTTITIKEVNPPSVTFQVHGVGLCSGMFPSIVGTSTCEGNVMEVMIDRSEKGAICAPEKVLLHLRLDHGKMTGRFGGKERERDNLHDFN